MILQVLICPIFVAEISPLDRPRPSTSSAAAADAPQSTERRRPLLLLRDRAGRQMRRFLLDKCWFMTRPTKVYIVYISGWGFNPSENISQLGLLFPIYGKMKNVPNHQPDI